MVLEHYNLREQPFGVTPDSDYLFASQTHREALASLLYGVEAGRGFMALIAKPGMGKTTLLFRAMEQLRKKGRIVFLFQAISTPIDFLRTLLSDLGVRDLKGSFFELQTKLNHILLEQARRGEILVVVVDETQNLDESVLELVRMLSNFETQQKKLMQIILSGQPQLATKLALPSLVQLRQRISIIAHLRPLSSAEVVQYVGHRLRVAGYDSVEPLFTSAAMQLIADYSEGVPRNINNLCFNALSLGCALKRKTIDCEVVREVVADLALDPLQENGVRLEPEDQNLAPTFATGAHAPSTLASRLLRIAFASAALLVLAGAGDARYRWPIPEATVQAKSLVPPLISVPPPSVNADRLPNAVLSTDTVLVTSGQTLYRICVENFAGCTPEAWREIRKLNPGLSNPDHIEAGQKIRIPVIQETLEVTQPLYNASPVQRGIQ